MHTVTEVWQPLSERESGKPAALRERLPVRLELPLRHWIRTETPPEMVEPIKKRFNVEFYGIYTWTPLGARDLLAASLPCEHLLDVTDYVLWLRSNDQGPRLADE